jgi:hypothetical protein
MCRLEEDRHVVAEFYRSVLRDAMRKGVIENHHSRWNAGIQASLLDACISLASACGAGLVSLRQGYGDVWTPDCTQTLRRIDILAGMMEIMSWTLDVRSQFGENFARTPLPSLALEKVHDCVGSIPSTLPNWTRAVAAMFQSVDGPQLIFEVRIPNIGCNEADG